MRSRYIALGLSILVVAIIFYYFSDIVGYVLVAWVLSMVGQPLMRLFSRIKIGKYRAGPTFCAVLTLFCYFIFFGALIGLFVPLIVEQARNLAGVDYNAIAKALEEPLSQINNWGLEIGLIQPGESPTEQVQQTLKGWFEPGKIGNFFGSLLSVAGTLVLNLFSVIFITFFFLKEQGLFVDFLLALVPNEYEAQVKHAVDDISKLLTRYFGGVLIQITVITLFVSILLGLFGVKNALLIGFFAAIINVIPYLGPLIGMTFGIFITISSNLDLQFYTEMLPLLLRVVAVFGALQMLDNFLLQPYIFSNSVLAHPLEIFIIILVGAKLNGVVGMILAIPAYTVIRVIARGFLSEFKIVKKITDGMGERA